MSSLRSRSRRAAGLALLALLAACMDDTPPTAAPPQPAGAEPLASHTGGVGNHVIDLQLPPGAGAGAMNDAGQVVGYGGSPQRGWVWTPASPGAATGTVQWLPTLGGSVSRAHDINIHGWIVGDSHTAEGGQHAALWVPDGSGGYTAIDLGVLGTGEISYAWGINDAGQIVGESEVTRNGFRRAFLRTPSSPGSTSGTMQDLGSAGGGNSTASDVNNHGWVVGNTDMDVLGDVVRGFLWTPGTGRIILDRANPIAINDAGYIVGGGVWLRTPSAPGSTAGTTQTIVDGRGWGLHSGAADLSETLPVTVVGWAEFRFDQTSRKRGFIWTQAEGIRPLPADGEYGGASAINEDGWIAGTADVHRPQPTGPLVRAAVIWRGVGSNVAPVARLTGPTSLISAHSYVMSAAGSTDADGDGLTFRWYYAAPGGPWVSVAGTGPEGRYVFQTPGSYTVRVIARDDELAADTTEMAVTVEQNVAPSVSFTSASYTGTEGALITLAYQATDANQAADSTEISTFIYVWDWGDGKQTVTRVPTARRSYPDQGTYPVRLIVMDGGRLADTATTTLTVANVAPTARLSTPTSVTEGSPYTLALTGATDAGAADRATLEFSFDCGQGGGYGAFGTAASVTCPARPDQAATTVRARVRDKDGGVSEYTRTLPGANARPVVQARRVNEGAPSGPMEAYFTDAGTADSPWEYRVYWGDGSASPWTVATPGTWFTLPAHAYAPGSYTAYVAVRDKDGLVGRSAGVSQVVP